MRKLLVGILLGSGAAAIVLALAAAGSLDSTELSLYDWRMRAVAKDPPTVHKDIVLVEINDTTLRDLDPLFGRFPWPRMAFSMLIDFLNRAPAKVIAVDFAFLEQDRVLLYKVGESELAGDASDAALVTAVANAPNTILLADANYEGLRDGEQVNKAEAWQAPPYRLGPRIFERRAIVTPFKALN